LSSKKTLTQAKGHSLALISATIWGTTFIATTFLLRYFQPIEIIVYRFILGIIALFIICPCGSGWKAFLSSSHRTRKTFGRCDKGIHSLDGSLVHKRGTTLKQELMLAGAGFAGITFYCILEKTALNFTAASNVGVIISTAPLFTALFAIRLLTNEKPKKNFYFGCIAALIGIFLISFSGATVLSLNPLGDLMAVGAASAWGIFNILLKKISTFGHHAIQVNRRIFSYGLLFMVPLLWPMNFRLDIARLANPVNLISILFLGLVASAFSFTIWNVAVNILGAVKTSIYIYIIPIVTVITSVLILGERITWMSALGIAFTLAGLVISEHKVAEKRPLIVNHDAD